MAIFQRVRMADSAGIQPDLYKMGLNQTTLGLFKIYWSLQFGSPSPIWFSYIIVPNETNTDYFRSDLRDKMYWNLIWKSPGFVPFRAILTHFLPESDIPVSICRISQGGPCGVLAAVQACLIQEMLFGEFKMADTRK